MSTQILNAGSDTRTKKIQKVADVWAECINPLDGLTQRDIEWMFEGARRGDDARLQLAFALIEQTMPIFGICMDKRFSQVLDLDWHVEGDNTGRIEGILRKCDDEMPFDGVSHAIEHLLAYSFRGRSVVKPFFDSDTELLHLKPVQNWNVLLKNSRFYWNPDSTMGIADFSKLTEVPQSEILFCTTERPVDMPGMLIYLRQTIGETKWSQFVERQGIPQVLITAPEGTPDAALNVWTRRAQQIMNGGSGVLPSGSKVDQLTDARGQDPFSDFCRHQMEMVAILATGGALNTIGGSTGLGSNLAEVQNEQFKKIVHRDVKNIERTMTRLVKWLGRKIGINQTDVQFKFLQEDDDKTEMAITTAERLKNLGAAIDLEKLRKYVKIDIFADEEQTIYTPDAEVN